jgi:endonuclease/exonuclease/phosphatase family metal-dependent hydrolase
MKLISLNTWGGRVLDPLLKFVEEQNNNIDIFCFQEMFKSDRDILRNKIRTNTYSNFQKILTDYNSYFAPMFEGHDNTQNVDFELFFGQAIFVKKTIKVFAEGNVFIYGKYGHEKTAPTLNYPGFEGWLDYPRSMHYVIIENGGKKRLICNLHGYWIPESKEDTPERLAQSDKILEFLKDYDCGKIVCGDFNLNPDTESIKKLEINGLTNLIKKYAITNTRSNLHVRKDKFADYIFTSDDIRVKDFRVIHTDVSDHLPLLLDFI